MGKRSLSERMGPFIERGLITILPTRWQIMQGAIEMLPHVVVPDENDTARYSRAPLGHPVVRTPFLVAYTLGGHFNVWSGLGASERALQKHLLGVHHFGQPVYDLQLAQTHPDGLAHVRRAFERVKLAASPLRKIERALVGAIIPDWNEYCDRMLGYVDRAERFDYDAPPSWARPEFWSLTSFLEYCAERFPPTLRGENPVALVRRLGRLFLRSRLSR